MDAVPQWTQLTHKRGLDPLAMQTSGIGLYQSLMPGISNVSLRMRYYGLYCWLSDTYAQRVGQTDLGIWRQWVRRCEALYALVAVATQDTAGVGGTKWASECLRDPAEVIDFGSATSSEAGVRQYLQQGWGVYGGAYVSQLIETGLFAVREHGLAAVTLDPGLKLAAAFRDAMGVDAEQCMIACIETGRASRQELQQLAPVGPSQILDGSLECELYRKLMLAEFETASEADQRRRHSLQLLLQLARKGRRPTADDARRQLFEADLDELPVELERQRLRWEAYHAQDLFQIAAAGVLEASNAFLRVSEHGATYGEVATQVEGAVAGSVGEPSWYEFREGLRATNADCHGWSQQLCSQRRGPADKLACAVRQMAALHARVDNRPDLAEEIERSYSRVGKARSIGTELDWFAARDVQPVPRLMATYAVERVIRRHTWVAMQKLRYQRDYTFLFDTHDGRLVHRADYLPVPTTPRLAPAIQFLADIHLVSQDGLTLAGNAYVGAES